MVKVFTEINAEKTLNSARIRISQFHNRLYSLAVELAKAIDVNESAPRTTGSHFLHRCDYSGSSVLLIWPPLRPPHPQLIMDGILLCAFGVIMILVG